MGYSKKSLFVYLAIALVFLSLYIENVECRRNVLRGRKTVTRTYMRPMAIPAWAVILLLGIGQLIMGAIVYVIMKKTIIDQPIQSTYTIANTNDV